MNSLLPIVLVILQFLTTPQSAHALGVNKRGFAKGAGSGSSTTQTKSVIDETSRQTVRNMFSVCSHIQDPALYQPNWADACQEGVVADGRKAVIATRDVSKGQALTLFPIHALGLRWLNRKNSGIRSKRENNKSANKDQDDVEFVAYDLDRDGDFINRPAGLRIRLNIPLDKDQPAYEPVLGGRNDRVLFAVLDTSREANQGWLGGKIHSASSTNTKSNCFTLPLSGAAPLCGIIATRDIKAGEELVRSVSSPSAEVIYECREIMSLEYANELSELKQYIEMACNPLQHEVNNDSGKYEGIDGSDIGPFHAINKEYAGVRQIHENPDIYAVDNFLSKEQCDRLIAKASPHLRPCLVKNEATGAVEQDPSRTNTDANVPQTEVPSIVNKLTELLMCDKDHLEILQVLHYSESQKFNAHTDGFDGPVSACGFEQANRIATVFCYLNDVDNGGATSFSNIDLMIKPKRGLAVVHFPSDLQLREDDRTLHEGIAPNSKEEKWLLTAWLWNKPRSDKRYSEEVLPSLSSDVI